MTKLALSQILPGHGRSFRKQRLSGNSRLTFGLPVIRPERRVRDFLLLHQELVTAAGPPDALLHFERECINIVAARVAQDKRSVGGVEAHGKTKHTR
jgi:hypothetical protein